MPNPLKSRTEPQGSAERSLNTNGLDTVKWSPYPSENKIPLLKKVKQLMLFTEQLRVNVHISNKRTLWDRNARPFNVHGMRYS